MTRLLDPALVRRIFSEGVGARAPYLAVLRLINKLTSLDALRMSRVRWTGLFAGVRRDSNTAARLFAGHHGLRGRELRPGGLDQQALQGGGGAAEHRGESSSSPLPPSLPPFARHLHSKLGEPRASGIYCTLRDLRGRTAPSS